MPSLYPYFETGYDAKTHNTTIILIISALTNKKANSFYNSDSKLSDYLCNRYFNHKNHKKNPILQIQNGKYSPRIIYCFS